MDGPWVDFLSTEHYRAIDQVRERLGESLTRYETVNTDWNILRFLRARNFDISKTQKMLAEYLAFRQRKDFNRIANLSKEQLDRVQSYFYHYHFAMDKFGRPLIMEDLGQSRLTEAGRDLSLDEIEDWMAQTYDRVINVEFPICSALTGRRIEKCVFVFDIGKVNVVKLFQGKFRGILETMIKIGQNYCPEILEVLFVVNAPFVFKGIWAIIQTMLDSKTRKKIHIESDNAASKLLKLVDAEQLPASLGGNNPLPLHLCKPAYQAAVLDSIQRRSLTLPNRELFNRFFLSQREQAALASIQQTSTSLPPSRSIGSGPAGQHLSQLERPTSIQQVSFNNFPAPQNTQSVKPGSLLHIPEPQQTQIQNNRIFNSMVNLPPNPPMQIFQSQMINQNFPGIAPFTPFVTDSAISNGQNWSHSTGDLSLYQSKFISPERATAHPSLRKNVIDVLFHNEEKNANVSFNMRSSGFSMAKLKSSYM